MPETDRIQEYAKAMDIIPQGLLARVITRCKRECKFFPQINEIWAIMLREIGGSRGQAVENLIENWLDRVYWEKCSIPFEKSVWPTVESIVATETEE